VRLTRIIQNKLRGAIQRYAPARVKQWLWDREFASGHWDHIDRPPTFQHPEIERYARGGAILDIGCGPGSTGNELTPGSYASYLGVDISEVCVRLAQQRTIEAGRTATNTYCQGDALSFVPPHPMDVIVFAEAIYYMPLAAVTPMLIRYGQHLTPGGHLIIRMRLWSEKYQHIEEAIRSAGEVVETMTVITEDGTPMHTLIVAPARRGTDPVPHRFIFQS
jgi:trans-aconitate methyltransferase